MYPSFEIGPRNVHLSQSGRVGAVTILRRFSSVAMAKKLSLKACTCLGYWCIATHCNTQSRERRAKRRHVGPRHTATHSNTLQHTATHCHTLPVTNAS